MPLLKELAARRPTALGRLHALWTLDVLAALPTALLTMGLRDPEARVREQAARLAERRIAHDPDLLAAVLPMADDPDPMVRFQVALTLGEASGDRRTLEALGSLAVRDAGDSWTRTAVLSSVGKSAPVLIEILAGKNRFFDTISGQLWLDELATLIGAGRDPVQLRRLVAPLVASRRDPDLMIRVLVAVNRGARRSGTSVSELLQPDWAKLIDPLSEQATEIALSDASSDRRLPAIALLGMSGARRALEALGGLLDARQPAPVQLAALQALGQVNDPAVGRLVVSHWKAMSPGVRREAAKLLFNRRNRLEHLLGALVSRTLAAAEIDPDRLEQLRNQKDPQLRVRAQRFLNAEPATAHDRKATLAAFQVAITLRGWPDNGHAAFLKTCATCHRVRGEGVEVGPDLATVAGRSPDDLLLHILDPNREVAPNCVKYNVATTDGRTISGIIASESATALTLKRALGVTEVVPRGQIEAFASTGL
ncbi:MAG: HEAT repeat domain-containing protein [Isosphaeraceae bacterium]